MLKLRLLKPAQNFTLFSQGSKEQNGVKKLRVIEFKQNYSQIITWPGLFLEFLKESAVKL